MLHIRKIKLVLILMLMVSLSFAQKSEKKLPFYNNLEQNQLNNSKEEITYDFTLNSTIWDFLHNPTVITNNQVWDDPEFSIPVDFDFYLNGIQIDSLSFRSGGGAELEGIDASGQETDMFIIPFGADIIDRGYNTSVASSEISYKLIGSEGSHILQIQWKNVGFYNEIDSLGTSTSYTNFQLWLFEANSKIEFIYGPRSIENKPVIFGSFTGPMIGLTNSDFSTSFLLSGQATNPTLMNSQAYIVGIPNANAVYTFELKIVGVEENLEKSDLQFSPNPVLNELFVSIDVSSFTNYSMRIYNSIGQVVYSNQSLNSNQFNIDVSDFDAGIFYIELMDKISAKKISKKIVKL